MALGAWRARGAVRALAPRSRLPLGAGAGAPAGRGAAPLGGRCGPRAYAAAADGGGTQVAAAPGGTAPPAGAHAGAEQAPAPLVEQLRGRSGVLEPRRKAGAFEERAAAAAKAGWQVVIHDYRDTGFLKKVTAAGLFCTLMSSSALSYAISLNWAAAACGGLALQTAAAFVAFTAYLRTCVARAALDPRRGNLVLTGCGYFGEPLAADHQIPLAMLEPGYSVEDRWIKFRVKGPAWNPATWMPYRMPRGSDGGAVKKGAQVGYRPPEDDERPSAAAGAGELAAARGGGAASPRRRFPGAGLSAEAADGAPAAPGTPRAPPAPARAAAGGARGERAAAADGAPSKTLAGLRLRGGLPLDAAEEQRLLDFFSDPTAYAVSMRS